MYKVMLRVVVMVAFPLNGLSGANGALAINFAAEGNEKDTELARKKTLVLEIAPNTLLVILNRVAPNGRNGPRVPSPAVKVHKNAASVVWSKITVFLLDMRPKKRSSTKTVQAKSRFAPLGLLGVNGPHVQ